MTVAVVASLLVAQILPFSILVMRAFMLGLPTDVLQAARVDGATYGARSSGSSCR